MFNIKSQLLGAAVLATGLIASAGSAQAAGLVGGFNYSDSFGTTTTGIKATIGKINNGFIDFVDPSVANLSNQFGDFTAFNGAKLYDITFAPVLTPNPSLFMDLAAGFPTQPGGPETPDGLNTFSLTSFNQGSPFISDYGTGANFTYTFKGIFSKDASLATLGDNSDGTGYITFAASYAKNGVSGLTALVNKYNNGSIDTSFTGLAVASTPEPTAMVGLGLVAAGMTVARRRKAVKA